MKTRLDRRIGPKRAEYDLLLMAKELAEATEKVHSIDQLLANELGRYYLHAPEDTILGKVRILCGQDREEF